MDGAKSSSVRFQTVAATLFSDTTHKKSPLVVSGLSLVLSNLRPATTLRE